MSISTERDEAPGLPAVDSSRGTQRLSVVIANYNYEQFVGDAITSALALDWDDLEVIVVDDGSTDSSLDVIGEYADRVRVLALPHTCQREAVNHGFKESTGDVIIFLDSDDQLPRELPRHLFAALTATTTKVQFQMQRVDSSGTPLGSPFPEFRPVPTPAQIKHWYRTTTAYPTPPGSANAYARWYLESIFPIGPEVGDSADSGPLACAPLVGDVLTLTGIPVLYRRHDGNDSSLVSDPTRFAREVRRAYARWKFASTQTHTPLTVAALFRSRELVQFRAAAIRTPGSQTDLPHDSRWRVLIDAVRSPFHPGPEPLSKRLVICAWTVAVLLSPRRTVPRLLSLRYAHH